MLTLSKAYNLVNFSIPYLKIMVFGAVGKDLSFSEIYQVNYIS
jgi:hypothetical protein